MGYERRNNSYNRINNNYDRSNNSYERRNYRRYNKNRNNSFKKIKKNNFIDPNNVIIEFNTTGKNIPIQNFPFKELLENVKEKQKELENLTNEVEENKVDSDVESIIIDSDDEIEELDISINS